MRWRSGFVSSMSVLTNIFYIISSQDFPDIYTVGQLKTLTEHCDFKSSTRTSGQLSILKKQEFTNKNGGILYMLYLYLVIYYFIYYITIY